MGMIVPMLYLYSGMACFHTSVGFLLFIEV